MTTLPEEQGDRAVRADGHSCATAPCKKLLPPSPHPRLSLTSEASLSSSTSKPGLTDELDSTYQDIRANIAALRAQYRSSFLSRFLLPSCKPSLLFYDAVEHGKKSDCTSKSAESAAGADVVAACQHLCVCRTVTLREMADTIMHSFGFKVDLEKGRLAYDVERFSPLKLSYDICYVRHGRTEGNTEPRVFQGQVDYQSNLLNSVGVQQAFQAAASLENFRPTVCSSSSPLSSSSPFSCSCSVSPSSCAAASSSSSRGSSLSSSEKNENDSVSDALWVPDLILTSPLNRAKQTAMPFCTSHPNIPCVMVDGLKEMAFGSVDNVEVRNVSKEDVQHLFYLDQNVIVKTDNPHCVAAHLLPAPSMACYHRMKKQEKLEKRSDLTANGEEEKQQRTTSSVAACLVRLNAEEDEEREQLPTPPSSSAEASSSPLKQCLSRCSLSGHQVVNCNKFNNSHLTDNQSNAVSIADDQQHQTISSENFLEVLCRTRATLLAVSSCLASIPTRTNKQADTSSSPISVSLIPPASAPISSSTTLSANGGILSASVSSSPHLCSSSQKWKVLIFGHSMAGAAVSILMGHGKTDELGYLCFDGSYTMPNATPTLLLPKQPDK